MSTLQVKNLPPDLHAALSTRAKEERVTMSEFVTRTLRKELSRPSLDAWIASVRSHPVPARDIDTAAAVEAGRVQSGSDPRSTD